ncbi:MAG: glycoside hydrolase family 9 protein [Candidatus Riflebacteria bacterium]|nr:glycoside hydrolase family 9 protein [Candidatus Riflebacteria bacterium]
MNKPINIFQFSLLFIGMFFVVSFCAAQDESQDILKPQVIDIRVLSDKIICVVLDSTSQIISLRNKKYSPGFFSSLKSQYKIIPDWLREKRSFYQVLSTWIDYRCDYIKRLEDWNYWKINGKNPEIVTYWPQSIDAFPESDHDFPSPPATIGLPRIADYVFMRLQSPILSGKPLRIEAGDEISRRILFDDHSTVCWSIKVNQAGYLTGKTPKFAYLGMWAGAMGAVDFSKLDGTQFHIYNWVPSEKPCTKKQEKTLSKSNVTTNGAADETPPGTTVGTTADAPAAAIPGITDGLIGGKISGEPLFSGKIAFRASEARQRYKNLPISGEDVYQLDFSEFTAEGNYCIVIPGLGRSWPFRISENIYGDVFFTLMKGIYAQRCGIEIKPPFSNWTRKACHLKTFRGGFPPELPRYLNNWYHNDKYDNPASGGLITRGFRNSTGEPVKIGPFDAVKSSRSHEVVSGLTGGWHDAADYDRRISHVWASFDLCAAFELYPEKFTDGQLKIPESDNGIPDILDEALVTIDFFRKTQTPEGGICGWAEQTSHPRHDCLPDEDESPFFISLPERNSSLQYSCAAAYAGRLIEKYDSKKSSELMESAKKAFSWSLSPVNSIRGITYEMEKKTVFFDQNDDLPGIRGRKLNPFKILAAIQLFLATKDDEYRKVAIADSSLRELFEKALPDDIPSFSFVSPLLHPEIFTAEGNKFLLDLAKKEADVFLTGQSEHAYRTLWRSPDHPYYPHISWGSIHAGKRAQFPLIVWRMTGEKKYYDAAVMGMDWELGCNEMGRSMITGVGSVFPVILQHIMSEKDQFLEPYPGFVPFTFSMGIAHPAYKNLFGIIDGGHPSVSDFFSGANLSMLPTMLDRNGGQAEINLIEKTGNWEKAMIDIIKERIEPVFPIMRRVYVHPYIVPQQNEFTVFETMVPMAAVAAILTPDNYRPPKELTDRLPRNTPDSLPIYFQP